MPSPFFGPLVDTGLGLHGEELAILPDGFAADPGGFFAQSYARYWFNLGSVFNTLNANLGGFRNDALSGLDQVLAGLSTVNTGVTNVGNEVGALSAQLTDAADRIIQGISGGAPLDLTAVVVELIKISLGVDVAGDLLVREFAELNSRFGFDLVPQIARLAQAAEIGAGGVVGTIRELTAALGVSVGPGFGTLATPLDNSAATAEKTLTTVLQPVAEAALADQDQMLALMDSLDAGTEGSFLTLIPWLLQVLVKVRWPAAMVMIVQVLREWNLRFPEAVQHIVEAVAALGNELAPMIERLHLPARATISGLTGQLFEGLDAQLAAMGQADEENVLPAAARILTTAAALGMTSHLVASAAEMAHPLKHLGLPQFAAFLTDLAGFRGIAQNSFGIQFETALREPARRRANERFRPSLPDLGRFEELFLKRLTHPEEFDDYLARLGWPDHLIARHLDAVFREPSVRELSLVFEDAELDEDWAVEKLGRRGYNDLDAEKLLHGLRARAQKSVRAAALGALEESFADGLLDEGELLDNLRTLEFDDASVRLIRLAAGHKRARKESDALRAALLREVELGQLDPEELRASLAAMGFDERAAGVWAQIGRIRVGARLFEREQAELHATVRRTQSREIEAQLDLFRRFLITEGQLAAALRAVGVSAAEVDALVELAAARRQPVPRLEEVLTPEALTQEATRKQAKGVLELQRKGVLTQQEAEVSLIAIAFPAQLAAADTRVVAAARVRPVLPARPLTPTEAEAQRRAAAREAVLERFNAGLTSVEELFQELLAAGVPDAAARALVTGEAARRDGRIKRDGLVAARKQLSAEQKALEGAAVEAFRAGRLDAGGLLQNLLAIGIHNAPADAIVKREEELKQTREERRAAREAAAAAKAEEREQARKAREAEKQVAARAHTPPG